MKTLRQYIQEAGEKGIAIGHFNISNLEMLHGIFNAARKLNCRLSSVQRKASGVHGEQTSRRACKKLARTI